ncbi:MAG: hypothetical protein NC299_18605 [Lachnospiraceae bacterium]|nr:hypothetical protein [Eubacterium sp.]MCM1277340.1 hypothetical protein [Lachnospiraceae bacterium]
MIDICPKCKNIIPHSVRVCPSCGVDIIDYKDEQDRQADRQPITETQISENSIESTAMAHEEPIEQFALAEENFLSEYEDSKPIKTTPSKTNTKWVVVAVACLAALIVAPIVKNTYDQKHDQRIMDEILNSIESKPQSTYSHSTTNKSTTTPVSNYDKLTTSDKKRICEYIQSRYDYYDRKEGRNTGDKYSDSIWQEVMDKYEIEEIEVSIIWQNYYNY